MEDVEKIIWLEGLKNAVNYKGKANPKAVIGKLMRDVPELRKKGKEIKLLVQTIIPKINELGIDKQKEEVLKMDPHALDKVEKKAPEKKTLPELPGAKQGEVVMRLAPYPSGALHVGNARMIVLNDEYVKKYKGKLLLVFDDTIGTTKAKMDEPTAKFVLPEAYDLIREGLDWLGVKYHKEVFKSDRVEIYQEEAGKLIAKGDAYVCNCSPEDFKVKFKRPGIECPCRNKSIEYHSEYYDQMKEGSVEERGAVVRLKTGMDQKDPALRDHIIMRISDAPHPRIGTKVRLWPVLEFSWGLDDHLLGITHIIRGIDLKKEGDVEKFIWKMKGWKESHITLYGRLKFSEDFTLSKTKSRQLIQTGEYAGWSDPRTWSLQSLESRGIHPNSVREALLDLGLSKRGIIFDEDWIYSKNKTMIDSTSNRYWFVENPAVMKIDNLPMENFTAQPLLHPNFPDRGTRDIPIDIKNKTTAVYIAKDDLEAATNEKGRIIFPEIKERDSLRIKDMFNIKINKLGAPVLASFESMEKNRTYRKIQAIPFNNGIEIQILQPNGITTEGFAEKSISLMKSGSIVQFERYGYVKIINNSGSIVQGYFTCK
jgi:glutamyl-tRNA synthetase